MKLIDFTSFAPLNDIREKMQAQLVPWESSAWVEIDGAELLRKLNSIEGIEVDIEELSFSSDGTFEYKGQKVLVYIRDQYYDAKNPDREYKFHISNCQTIKEAFAKGRSERYVVSTRTDGRFLVNVREWSTRIMREENKIKELKVCKVCLQNISYAGYRDHLTHKAIYINFSLGDFFQKYGATQHTKIPKHTDISAPPDEYSENFSKLSQLIRQKGNWRCERCNRDFRNNKRFLHVHHLNGVKSDNSFDNLKVLCICCHSKEADHKQLKYSPDYKKYIELFGEC